MKKIAHLTGFVSVLMTSAVLAENPSVTCPPPCPPPCPVVEPSPCPVPVPPCCPKAFQGFFVGGNIGLGIGAGSQSKNVSAEHAIFFAPTSQLYSSKNRLGVKGVDGGVNVGYNYRIKNYGIGLEFVANWTGTKGSVQASIPSSLNPQESTTISQRAKLTNSLQLRGNFSYVIAELVAPKFIIGWDTSKWHHNSIIVNADTLTSAGNPVPFSAGRSKYINGVLLGLGVDFLASQHFTIGLDATVSLFSRSSYASTFTNTALAANYSSVTQSGSFKPQTYTKVALTAKYIF